MQQAFAHKKEFGGDAVRSSTDTSRWSTPPRLRCDSSRSYYTSDFGDQDDTVMDKAPEVMISEKWPGSNTCGRKKGKKAQGPNKQKTKYTANSHFPKLPPIKPLQVSNPGVLSTDLNCIRELKSQVWDLQQQLSEARTENKLLKRLQHRHTVALQHFQDSEGSLSTILTNHSNEARVLQGLLRETRACRDNLARQLQTTENKLLSTKSSLQRLQLLSQDHSLLEREELTFRLTRASAELEDKDKRILDLEKNLELCQASFNRQIVTEQRKITEARKISCYLQEQIYQLNKEIQDRERELETHNIYSHRYLKGPSKKVSKSKMVQTDGIVLLPTAAVSVLALEHTETEEKREEKESSVNWCCYNPVQEYLVTENPEKEDSANVSLEENHEEETGTCADTSEQRNCSEDSPEYQTEEECAEVKEAPTAPQVLEEGQKTEEHESETSFISEQSPNLTEPKKKGSKVPKNRLNYTFKQSTENMHSGRPAYSRGESSPRRSDKSPITAELISSGIQELCPTAEKSRKGEVGSAQGE
ncbi:LOW QUALITY PROTEIN: lebercilin-like protein [Anoplopoma fimbria]|uniref:LOW QUALITY PROTEIN: lebercilin-like protein n=1 Tax=Anoplopoma fimbria TaxID=229290 RepID=UPI0023EB438F|nr:LOW QUALITY PROTEIN: lebercilin-like protein [Anoplopoma fimbria]